MDTSKKLIKAFSDAIPMGPHPEPRSEWIQVRLDFVQEAIDHIDHIDWIEKGINEWKQVATQSTQQRNAAQATARIAIGHLQNVLSNAHTPSQKSAAAEAARDWLVSIGSEP